MSHPAAITGYARTSAPDVHDLAVLVDLGVNQARVDRVDDELLNLVLVLRLRTRTSAIRPCARSSARHTTSACCRALKVASWFVTPRLQSVSVRILVSVV